MDNIRRRDFLLSIGAGFLGLGLERVCEAEGPRAKLGLLGLDEVADPGYSSLSDDAGLTKLASAKTAAPAMKRPKRKQQPKSNVRGDLNHKDKKVASIDEKRMEKEFMLEPFSRDIYLTIDDSPSDSMPTLLSNLGNNHAIFFVYGEKVCLGGEYLPEKKSMLIAALNSGNILGNHSFLHHHYCSMPLDAIKKDIEKTDKIVEEIYKEAGISRRHKLMRFPYGDAGFYRGRNGKMFGSKKLEAQVMDFIKQIGYKNMPYTCDSMDYKTQSDVGRIDADKVIARCRMISDGATVLCHCIPVTAEKVVPYFVSSKAYKFLLPEPNVQTL